MKPLFLSALSLSTTQKLQQPFSGKAGVKTSANPLASDTFTRTVRFGNAADAGEPVTLESLKAQLGDEVPELFPLLEKAQTLAAEKGHAQTTSLHLLSVILKEMVQQSDSTQDARQEMMEGMEEKSLWHALFGNVSFPIFGQVFGFQIQPAVDKLESELDKLPKAAGNETGAPPVSQDLLDTYAAAWKNIPNKLLSKGKLESIAAKVPDELQVAVDVMAAKREALGKETAGLKTLQTELRAASQALQDKIAAISESDPQFGAEQELAQQAQMFQQMNGGLSTQLIEQITGEAFPGASKEDEARIQEKVDAFLQQAKANLGEKCSEELAPLKTLGERLRELQIKGSLGPDEQTEASEIMGKLQEGSRKLTEKIASLSEADPAFGAEQALYRQAQMILSQGRELPPELIEKITGEPSPGPSKEDITQVQEKVKAFFKKASDSLEEKCPEEMAAIKALSERMKEFQESDDATASQLAQQELLKLGSEERDMKINIQVGLAKKREQMLKQRAKYVYHLIMHAPLSTDTPPGAPETETIKATKAIVAEIKTLVTGNVDQADYEKPEECLKMARANGTNREGIAALTRLFSKIKQVQAAMSQSRPGDMMPEALRLMRKLTGDGAKLIQAYAKINWQEVRGKHVDEATAFAVIDGNPILTQAIKTQLKTYIRQANRKTGPDGSSWHNPPMLLLQGGPSTSILKAEIVKVLTEALGMPIYQPHGNVSTSPRLSMGGQIEGANKLSVPANALLETGTPRSIVFIDNILRFMVNGGRDQFDQFTSAKSRKEFEEPDLELPLDLSSYVFVAGLEDGISARELVLLHNDRFNDKDISIIDLNQNIDVFTKVRVLKQAIAPELEATYNVKFDDAALEAIALKYCYTARYDHIEDYLRDAAKKAVGQAGSSTTPITITASDLERYLGPAIGEVNVMDRPLRKPTVGAVNGMGAGQMGSGSILRIGLTQQARFKYDIDPEKLSMDKPMKRIIVESVLGPVGDMAEDSAKKAVGNFMVDLLNQLDAEGSYAALKNLKNTGYVISVNFQSNVDGPSAGAAMATAAVSLLTGIPVRHDVSITGTYEFGGEVGIIGGIYEKVQAAYRAGMKKVVMPEYNYKQLLHEHPKFVRILTQEKGVELVPVTTVDEVFQHALTDYDKLKNGSPETGAAPSENTPAATSPKFAGKLVQFRASVA